MAITRGNRFDFLNNLFESNGKCKLFKNGQRLQKIHKLVRNNQKGWLIGIDKVKVNNGWRYFDYKRIEYSE